MMPSTRVAAVVAVVVVLTAVAASMPVATQQSSSVQVNASPTDPNEAESTHTVVFTPSLESAVVGSTFDDIRINYSADTPAADVSNVGAGTIERIGIDRGGDDVGTRIDVTATVTEVSAKSDGTDLLIRTNQELTIQTGDEVVVVIRPVQNPQTSGDVKTPNVDVVLNTEGTADSATDTVTYEYNDAAVNITDQSTSGGTVTVDQVNLSEDGYVAVANESGRNPSSVRGATYLEAGTHSDVEVDIEPPVADQTELWAQVHLDSNGDQRFNYTRSGGEVDEPFENRVGNVMASDGATVFAADRTQTPTPTASDDAGGGDAPTISNFQATADDGTITVTFDSDETLTDIEVDVRGADAGTMHTEDFDGNPPEGYTGTYQADAAGDYTLELVEAEDSGGENGAEDGDYTDTATVQDAGTSTPTPPTTPADDPATPTDETDPSDGTATPTTAEDPDGTSTDGAETATSDEDTEGTTTASAAGDDVDTATQTDDDGAGFGGIVALTALVATALLVDRRH